MAVQAQYPSNILLLNSNRNGQELNDYPLQQPQQQKGGGFLDQSHIFFNNNGGATAVNSRKRGRELATNEPINIYTMQQQPFQLIDLSQLHNNNTPQQHQIISTGLGLSFSDHQLQNHHHQKHQQQTFTSSVSDDLAIQLKRQRDEMDQFLITQGEQLRRTLADKWQGHYRALLGAADETLTRKLREKEAQFEAATRRNAELEARAARLRAEAQVWQAKARAQEATAASLQARLREAITSGGGVAKESKRGEDGGGSEAAEDAESAYIDPDRVAESGPSCKTCRERVATVVLLPCRHLCLCAECDRVAHACPLCLCIRNSSVEVLLS